MADRTVQRRDKRGPVRLQVSAGTGGGARARSTRSDLKTDHGMARGHLLGRQLGGDGNDPRNLVTLAQNPANSPAMRDFEAAVRKAVEAGETVDYKVTPVYLGDSPVAVGVTMSAQGDGNPPFSLEVSIINQKKTGERFGHE
jgi:hypothetical protein